jgi:hypothetical protein
MPTLLKLLSGARKSIDIISLSFAIGIGAGKFSSCNGLIFTD